MSIDGNDGLRGLPVSALEKNLRATIRLAKEHGVRVVLGGMKLPPNFGAKYVRDFEYTYVRVAKEEKTEFIPFILDGVGGDTKLNQDDGIHPNEAGHLRIAQTVQKKFEELLK